MLRTAFAALGSCLLVAGCVSQPAAVPPPGVPPPAVGPAFVDLTDDFARLYEESAALPEAERAAHMREGLSTLLPGYYTGSVQGVDQARIDGFIAKYLAKYPAERAAIATVAKRFDAMMTPGLADFTRRVGPLPAGTPVYLIVSMGEFDGATRTIAGREYLLFGADVIASIHSGNDPRPLVQHELFHIYHSQHMGDCTGLYCSLWQEGLAVHAAHVLNPKATDAELLLTMPEPIRPALEANRREAICTTLAKLDSRDSGDWNAFFSNGRLNDHLPPRFGYLVGSWVAADLGRTRSLAELARLDGKPLRDLIGESLRGMAACG